MSFFNPQHAAAAQLQAINNLPGVFKVLNSHTGELVALKALIAAIAATLCENETFKAELENQLSKALPQPGQLVTPDLQPIVAQARKTFREILPANLSDLIPD